MLSDKALAARRLYMSKWREEKRESIAEYNKEYRKNNKEKFRKYQDKYWNKKAVEGGF
jgi:hypothetical protein